MNFSIDLLKQRRVLLLIVGIAVLSIVIIVELVATRSPTRQPQAADAPLDPEVVMAQKQAAAKAAKGK